uniref:Uncharacterized protein n=1 Tax=Anguilla anguilla TaxID=7936 RepID=A0A0E9PXH0_ANGAN
MWREPEGAIRTTWRTSCPSS